MGELVNLNRYRKRQGRQADGAAAAENRVRHGTKRAERRREAAKREREAARLDGKKRDAMLRCSKTARTSTNRATPANSPPPPRPQISEVNLGPSLRPIARISSGMRESRF